MENMLLIMRMLLKKKNFQNFNFVCDNCLIKLNKSLKNRIIRDIERKGSDKLQKVPTNRGSQLRMMVDGHLPSPWEWMGGVGKYRRPDLALHIKQ